MLISVATCTYECYGKGYILFDKFLRNLKKQTYKEIEIVVSDQSKDDRIKKVAKEYEKELNIKYLDFDRKDAGAPANINNALKNCSGELIKILFMDDFFYRDDALEIISKNFKENPDKHWLANGFTHTNEDNTGIYYNFLKPKFARNIFLGNNTLGAPSNITVRKKVIDEDNFLNERLLYCCDCEFYHRLYLKYKHPIYLNETLTVSFIHKTSVTTKITKNEGEGIYKKSVKQIWEEDKKIMINELGHKPLKL